MIFQYKTLSYTEKKRLRVNFGKHDEKLKVPHLYDIQLRSYEKFIKNTKNKNGVEIESGLARIFKNIFPIYSNNKNMKLEYIQYTLSDAVYSPSECKVKGLTYSSPLKLKVHLCTNYQTKNNLNPIKSIIQDIYILNMPLMTKNGTFIINGTERVIVSQLHKSPGLFFEMDKLKSNVASNKFSYIARVIPYRGAWLDIEFDSKDCLFARIDKKKKFPITMMLKALGMDVENILNIFSKAHNVCINDTKSNTDMLGQIVACNIKDTNNETLFYANTKISSSVLDVLKEKSIDKINIIYTSFKDFKPYIHNTLNIDQTHTESEAKIEIHKILRPGEPPTQELAKQLFEQLFFSSEKYDLSSVGRMKINERLRKFNDDRTVLSKDDIVSITKKLIKIKNKN